MEILTGEDAIKCIFNFLCDIEIELHKENKNIDVEFLDFELKKNFNLNKNKEKSFKIASIIFNAALTKFKMFQSFYYFTGSLQDLKKLNEAFIKENKLQNTEIEKTILEVFNIVKNLKEE